MATSVQVTLIICTTVLLLFALNWVNDRLNSRSWRGSNRLGLYERFFAALADVKDDPTARKGWDRLASAAHAISLTAPPNVVAVTIECCREIRERRGPATAETAKNVLLVFRDDLGLPAVPDPDSFEFDVVPSSRIRDVA